MHPNRADAVSDWMKIVLLPIWLIGGLKLEDLNPTWIIVVKTVLVTLLVYQAGERRWAAHKERS